ncbi:penicillin acylase family protein [Corallococcus praedator]|uniref:Penicillin acylase family protein n=1 Tax=Corallococcus praedator TaxID=2316724 RepID=A0ABX9QP33_9BACT|nr:MULTISPECIES: penicillin acylase family protein [Corallococcus]RKH17377.1 penicillin acylase family protein [Corallococcus sp. CA047B]RKH34103.1 penicillin acylase family protein [Corallococcus sp. CA031C]RKI12870.1 penicillin acylase family protein [Corallococcus praedator]
MSALSQVLRMLRMLPSAMAVATPGLGPWLARRRWPRAEGTLTLPGLHGKVEVLRDTWGVPHLYAQDDHDLFFAQGYVHGQDRLFQLEMGRRLVDGRLASLLGPALLPVDQMILTLGLRHMAEQSWPQVDPEARAVLEAYSAGINARIAAEPLAYEFTVLDVTPAPWTPMDTLTRGNLLALMLGGNNRLELLRARLVAAAGEEVANALLPQNAPETPLIVPKEARLPGLKGVKSLSGLDKVDAVLGDPNIVSGSNNWVVHGQRTQSGKPLLANDVHIGLGFPSTFYENGLHGGRFDHVGFSLPGVPLLIIGHNGKIAWGMSNLGPDTQDFYIEKLDDPKAPKKYLFQDTWHELHVRREEIPVKGGTPVVLEVKSTRHGPLMNAVMGDELKDSEPLALKWAHGECQPLFNAVLRLNLATDWESFRGAMKLWESPGQNFVYADTAGNIGYQASGKIPIRQGHQGLIPMPGWTGEAEWTSFIPFEELPASFNPPAGYAATANNKITSDDYPYLIAHNWFPGYRAKRITDLLEAGTKHTVEDMRRIQAETYSLPAEALRPYFLSVAPGDDAQKQAVAALQAWDLRFEPDAVGATVFQAWYIEVLRRLLQHKLGPELVQQYLLSQYERHGSLHMPFVIGLMSQPESPWWDDPKTPAKETRDDILRAALADATAWLGKTFGPKPEGWAWGKVHTLTYTHQPLGGPMIPGPIRRAFNTRTVPARGDNYSVDGASFLWSHPFNVVHGTALRMIVDLEDFSRSMSIHAPGQTEHLFHPHRDDLLDLSREVKFHPMLYTRDAVEQHREATLTLTPAVALVK